MSALKIKKGDNVVVLAGRDKGKRGEVIEVRPKENRALVRGVNMIRRHQRQTRQPGRRHHFEGRPDPHFEHCARGSQGRQADPRRFQVPERRQEGPRREALGRADPGEEVGHG